MLIGEKSAEFDLDKQKITSWVYFAVVLGVVLFVLDLIWIDNSTGFGKDFVDAVGSLSQSHEVYMYDHMTVLLDSEICCSSFFFCLCLWKVYIEFLGECYVPKYR